MTSKPARHYCITFWKKPVTPDCVRYAIYGEEICPDTGRLHWQSYIELNKPMRLDALTKAYNDKQIRAEPRHGTRDQAREYCMKDKKYEEVGVFSSGQGRRTDINDFVEKMENGEKLSALARENPMIFCSYRNGLKDINSYIVKEKTKAFRHVNVILIIGPTDLCKTKQAVEEAEQKGDYYMIDGDDIQWFDHYEQEETLIIDEYDNNVTCPKLIKLLDGYQKRIMIKGSTTYAAWTTVYITSNLRLHEIHENAKPAHRAALFRRIKEIRNLWPIEPVTEVIDSGRNIDAL